MVYSWVPSTAWVPSAGGIGASSKKAKAASAHLCTQAMDQHLPLPQGLRGGRVGSQGQTGVDSDGRQEQVKRVAARPCSLHFRPAAWLARCGKLQRRRSAQHLEPSSIPGSESSPVHEIIFDAAHLLDFLRILRQEERLRPHCKVDVACHARHLHRLCEGRRPVRRSSSPVCRLAATSCLQQAARCIGSRFVGYLPCACACKLPMCRTTHVQDHTCSQP